MADEASDHAAQWQSRVDFLAPVIQAQDDMHAVLDVVLGSASHEQALDKLAVMFGLTPEAAAGIMDLQVRRLTSCERNRIRAERDGLVARIKAERERGAS